MQTTVGGRTRWAHAIIAAAFIGERPHGYTVNHKDLNPANNVPGNLEYVSVAENNRHARANRPWSPFDRCKTCGMTSLMHRPDKSLGCQRFISTKEKA